MKKSILLVAAMFVMSFTSSVFADEPLSYDQPAYTPPVASAEEVNASIAAQGKKTTHSILKSRAIQMDDNAIARTVEENHYQNLKKENRQTWGFFKAFMASTDSKFEMLGDKIDNNFMLLMFFGLLATALIIGSYFLFGRTILVSIRALAPPVPGNQPNQPNQPNQAAQPGALAPNAQQQAAPALPAQPGAPLAPVPGAQAPAQAGPTAYTAAEAQLAEARHNDRHEELVNLLSTIPTVTAGLVKKLDPLHMNYLDVSGKKVSFTPEIVNDEGTEMYLSLYIPSTTSDVVPADPCQIQRLRYKDAGDCRRACRKAIAKYIALTAPGAAAPANVQERTLIALCNYLKGNGNPLNNSLVIS